MCEADPSDGDDRTSTRVGVELLLDVRQKGRNIEASATGALSLVTIGARV
jgi:hypothetical protein